MGLPNIVISFRTRAAAAIQRSEKGTVALLLQEPGEHFAVTAVTDIPEELSEGNKAYLKRALIGYQNPPKKVICACYDGEERTMEEALLYLETQRFDYLAGAPELTEGQAQDIASWVKSRRLANHMVKAVLPCCKADHEGIVNFTATGIQSGNEEIATAAYCSRIAGLIAGTPMTISCTYAPLPELTGVEKLAEEELDAKVDAGELVLVHDGEKVKIGRAVNSLVTTTQDKGEAFQKIKILEAVDMIETDIRRTVEDSYIGKYANSYDNKCLLIMAIKGYLEALELDGILQAGSSSVEIDLAAQENYLKSRGVQTEEMTEQQIKEANTGSMVFLACRAKVLDAIEDVKLDFTS